MRAAVLALCALAGVVAGFGCSVFCADCDCGDGPFQVNGTVTSADRKELVGADVHVTAGSVEISWNDGSSWEVYYQAVPE
jgi:hypothetical protein